MTNSISSSEKGSNGLFFNAIVLALSSYIGLFFAYIVQQSYSVFSYSLELTSYISAHGIYEYGDMAYSLIKECYSFSDRNLIMVIAGLVTFTLLVVLLKSSKISFKNRREILLSTSVILSVIVWFIEPLIVVFSSLENPDLAYLIARGKIPEADVAVLSHILAMLDRFRLFSKGFFFSFHTMAFATSVLLSSLSFSKLADYKLGLWKRNIASILSVSPLIVLFSLWFLSPSMDYYFLAPSEGGAIYFESLGPWRVGVIFRPFLEYLHSGLWWLLGGLWGTTLLCEIIFESKRKK